MDGMLKTQGLGKTDNFQLARTPDPKSMSSSDRFPLKPTGGKTYSETLHDPATDGVVTPFFWLMTPFFKGHGESGQT